MKPRTPVVLALIAINVAMFVVEIVHGADAIQPTPQQLLDIGANYGPLTLGGEYWRLGAAMFLHFGILHIGMNMLCLWSGRIVEHLYGSFAFACMYLAAGLLGGVASLARSSAVVSAGASGAVFGVFGAFGAFIVMRRTKLNPEAVRSTGRSLLSFVGLNLIIGFTVPGIDITAHVGGLIGGFLVGVVLLAGDSSERQRNVRAIVSLVVAAGLSLGAMQIIPVSAAHPAIAADKIIDLNNEVFTRRDKLDKQLDAKEITQQQYYDILEREIIPKWHAARLQLDGVKVAPESRLRLEKLKNYVSLEEDELQALSDMLRQGKAYDEDARKAFQDKQELASESRKDLQDDLKNLSTGPSPQPVPQPTPQ